MPATSLRAAMRATSLKGKDCMTDRPLRSVKSAERVFDILEFAAQRPEGVTFPEISEKLRIPKSSLHALLDVICLRGYLELDPDRRRYRLGLRVWEAGQAFPRHHDILDVARAVMRDLVANVNETAQLARLSGRDNVYLAKEDCSHPLRLQSDPGARLPAHATGVGKALLAQLDEDELAARMEGAELARFTPTTITTLPALRAELAETRARGFAVDDGEYTPGLFCLAVPVYERAGKAALALSLSVPSIRVRRDSMIGALRAIADASAQLSARIGVARTDPALAALAAYPGAEAAIDALHAMGRGPRDLAS